MVGYRGDHPVWCCDRPAENSVRYGPHHQAVLQWLHFGLEAAELHQLLADIEASHWSGPPTGWVDESMQMFDENELQIAKQLAAEGHNVTPGHFLSLGYVKRREMVVGGFQAIAVVDNHAVPSAVRVPTCEGDGAFGSGQFAVWLHWRPGAAL